MKDGGRVGAKWEAACEVDRPLRQQGNYPAHL